MKNTFVFFGFCLLFIACDNKSDSSPSVVGQWNWTIQYLDFPPFSKTPETTGLQETLILNADQTYSVTINNKTTNSGTYKKKMVKALNGKSVPAILYSNTRVNDSICYYSIDENNSKLRFDAGLIGIVGAGLREYSKN